MPRADVTIRIGSFTSQPAWVYPLGAQTQCRSGGVTAKELSNPIEVPITTGVIAANAGAPIFAFFVSTTGDNANSGAIDAPWQTIDYAVDHVSPGDTIFVRGGTYNERVTIGVSGAVGQYITLSNYQDETVILDGTGLGNGYMVHGEDISYFKIIGLEIKNHTGAGITFWGSGSNIEIRDNWIYNQTFVSGPGHAILVSGATPSKYNPGPEYVDNLITDVVIDNNTIGPNVATGYSSGDGAIENFNEALTLAWNIKRWEITNNTIVDCSHIGTSLIGYTSFRGGPLAFPQYGRFANNEYNLVATTGNSTLSNSGLHIDGAKDIVVEDNKFIDNRDTGIDITFEDATFTVERIIIRRNQVIRGKKGMHPMGYIGPANNVRVAHNSIFLRYVSGNFSRGFTLNWGSDVILKNNIVQQSGANEYLLDHFNNTSYSPQLDYNLYNPRNGYYNYKGTTYFGATAFDDYQSGSSQDANGRYGNPLFTNVVSNDLTPAAGSPAINNGGFLTQATNNGNNSTILNVADARWFHAGFGIDGLSGDTIRVGSETVTVIAVDYATNQITLNSPISWSLNDGVTYPFNGGSPDIGAVEV
jgi:hypothetical protein